MKQQKNKLHRIVPLIFIIIIGLILAYLLEFTLHVSSIQPFCTQPKLKSIPIGLVFIAFSTSFWLVYYLRLGMLLSFLEIVLDAKLDWNVNWPSWLEIFTLGSLLDDENICETRSDTKEMQDKARLSLTFPILLSSFSIVFVGFLFTGPEPLIQETFFQIIANFIFVSLILIIIGFDSFDTCLNKFKNNCKEYVEKYYRRGMRLSYLGMHLIMLSFLIVTLYIHWIVTLLGTLSLFTFGYSYWFPSKPRNTTKL